jgi:alkylation response protein AidB-like acyl-CoA dehydrogenase
VIDFELTEEQRAAIDMAHDFALNELRPIAAEWDQKGEFPQDLILPKACQAGLTSAGIPEEFGGGGLDPLTSAMVFEECHEKTAKLAAFALTEPGAGSDVSAISTNAKADGDNYILNGQKCFITNGGISDVYTVFAQTDQGLSGFIVDGKSDGITMGKHEDKLGIRASHTAEVFFEDVKVPKEDMLGAPGSAFVTVMLTLDQTRAGVAALAVGVARAAFEEANAYAKERVQFGKPIMVNQAISFMLVDMLMNIEAGRRLYYYAGWLANKMAESGKTSRRLSVASSIAKAFCGDMAMKVTTDAVQVMGGYGYMKDYPVEKYMRDAKIMQIYEGTAQIQRYVISASLMGIKEVKQ